MRSSNNNMSHSCDLGSTFSIRTPCPALCLEKLETESVIPSSLAKMRLQRLPPTVYPDTNRSRAYARLLSVLLTSTPSCRHASTASPARRAPSTCPDLRGMFLSAALLTRFFVQFRFSLHNVSSCFDSCHNRGRLWGQIGVAGAGTCVSLCFQGGMVLPRCRSCDTES